MFRKLLLAALGAVSLVQQAPAATPITGVEALNEWNLIVLRDFKGNNAHVHGSAFIGGNVNGPGPSEFNMDQIPSTRGQPGLTVVGNVSGSNKVRLGATIGGSVSGSFEFNGPDQTVKVGGTMPAVNVNGNTLQTGLASPAFLDPLTQQRDALVLSMIALSDQLSGLGPTLATAGVDFLGDKAAFSATGSGLNVISLTGSQLAGLSELSFANSGTTIVNVSGTDIDFAANFGGSKELGDHVLWNFFEAQSLDIDRQFLGSVLAPHAIANVNQEVWGSVAVYDLNLNHQIHPGNFVGNPGAVPEPATWAMMIMGFGLIGAQLRSRRRRVPAAA